MCLIIPALALAEKEKDAQKRHTMAHPPDHIPDLDSPRSRSPIKKDKKEKVKVRLYISCAYDPSKVTLRVSNTTQNLISFIFLYVFNCSQLPYSFKVIKNSFFLYSLSNFLYLYIYNFHVCDMLSP